MTTYNKDGYEFEKFVFNSEIRYGNNLNLTNSSSTSSGKLEISLKDEPMFFTSSKEFVRLHGGPLSLSFLDALDDDWKESDLLIDSRVHMLMPGWWPCIPGWHHDDVPRDREDGQPDYINTRYKAEHALAVVGDVAPTEFGLGVFTLPEVELGKKYYDVWNKELNKIPDSIKIVKATPGRIIYFDYQTFHRGTQSEGNGWRWFMRATRYSDRNPLNEIRRQVNVYMEIPESGW